MTLTDTELLARLVAFDSTSRNSNLPIADFLCDYLSRPGVDVTRNYSVGGDKTNLIVWVGPKPEPEVRKGLILSGHMDVVPADEEGWRSDPFALTEQGNTYVARGVCDMKGFLALAANLAAEVVPERLVAPLVLIFSYDEEVGTMGARRLTETFAEAPALPRQAIIGEPTSLHVVRAHKGHLRLRITLGGRSAHSGYPHLGVNAIESAGRVLCALSCLRHEIESEEVPHRELFPDVPYVSLNIGTVHGGSAINVVPDRCTIELGLRTLPGSSSGMLIERVRRAAVAAATAQAPEAQAPEVEVITDSPPLLLDEAAPIHRYLCTLVGDKVGGAVSFATDGGWLQQLGIDCAIWGPGSIEVAHRPNEYLPKSDFAAARVLIERTIDRFCVQVP